MPIKSEADKLSIGSFPFDIPDVGSAGKVAEEEDNYEQGPALSRTNSTEGGEEVTKQADPDLFKDDSVSNITKG